jgi:hypothetical protein
MDIEYIVTQARVICPSVSTGIVGNTVTLRFLDEEGAKEMIRVLEPFRATFTATLHEREVIIMVL